jgi:hypothetical protein
VLRETFPPGAPGRKRKISPEQWPVLLERSQQLQPAIWALIKAHRVVRKRSLNECLRYIEADYPEQTGFLLAREARLKQVLADKKLLGQVATEESTCRLVADAIAGAEFALSARYSLQLCRTARRNLSHRKRAAVQQKI